jgi:hypothetical protein
MIVLVFIAIGIILVSIGLLIGEVRRHLARARDKEPQGPPKRARVIPKVERTSVLWTVSLALLCLGILAYGYYFPQQIWSNLNYHLGRKVAAGFIIWMIFNVTFGRKQGTGKAVVSVWLICGATITSGLIAYKEAESAGDQLKAELRQVVTGITNTQEPPPYIEGQTNTVSGTRREFVEIERYVKTCMTQFASLGNDYSQAMAASGLEDIMDPKRLEQDGTLLESKMIVQHAKEVVIKYRTKSDVLRKNVLNGVGSLKLDDAAKRDFERGMKDGTKQFDELWECEAKIVSIFDQIVALLSKSRGAWTLQDGEIVFGSERDSRELESYVNSLQELARKEHEIEKRGLDAAERMLK